MANHYDVPTWAGKPPTGLHLDVLKGDKLIQKLMIDEKRCYLFGRNPQMNDFCIDHASCSRVHAAFVYHKHLGRAFLVDLGSTHGTYIGKMRLDPQKPTQLPIDSIFHFGASTRNYIIRERPTSNARGIMEDIPNAEKDNVLFGLPENQVELDNLTEYNTAHNRRISMLGVSTEEGADAERKSNSNAQGTKRPAPTPSAGPPKKQKRNVSFNEEVDIINPEDIDPNVGRFRNLVKSTIVPNTSYHSRKMRLHCIDDGQMQHALRMQELTRVAGLYTDLPAPGSNLSLIGARLGIALPNPAPEVEFEGPEPLSMQPPLPAFEDFFPTGEQRRKKYAKEAWPGRKPSLVSGL